MYSDLSIDGSCVIAPDVVSPLDDLRDSIRYYESLERFCRACGEYSRIDKLRINVIFDTPQEELTDKKKFEARRCRIAKLEQRLSVQEHLMKAYARNYGYWHQRVGFGKFSKVDKEHILAAISDLDFRERIYRRIRKYKDLFKPISWVDLHYEVVKSFLKQGKLPFE